MKHLNNWVRVLRRSVLCVCVAVACVWCLPSCNDDKIGDVSLIYGRWEATSFSGYEKEEGEEPYEWNYGPSEMAGDYVISTPTEHMWRALRAQRETAARGAFRATESM